MKLRAPSFNINANVGSVAGIEYQKNGTERLKGSYPHLITNVQQIMGHLKTDVSSLLESLGPEKVSRVSSRYFVTGAVVRDLSEINGMSVSFTKAQIEAIIPLGSIFLSDGIKDPVFWVWIGANVAERKVGKKIKTLLTDKFEKSVQYWKGPSLDTNVDGYKVVVMGTKRRLQTYKDKEIPHGISKKIINERYAKQIAHMFALRLPVYVAPSGDWKFIKNEIADSDDITLFSLMKLDTDEVVACAGNEFCHYPVGLPNGKSAEVVVCESNDWVKRKDIPRPLFITVLSVSLKNAFLREVPVIETECIREAFTASGIVGFQPAGLLERTSHMANDATNFELKDPETTEDYRKFSSLWLYYMVPATPAWEYWKTL